MCTLSIFKTWEALMSLDGLRYEVQSSLDVQADKLRLLRERLETLSTQQNGGKHDRNEFGARNPLAPDRE